MDHAELIWRDTATDHMLAAREWIHERQPVTHVALERLGGHALAEAVVAPSDAPPVSRATMDGFAIAANGTDRRTVRSGEIFPEDDPGDLATDEAVRIATGAPLPDGADAVLKREEVTVSDGTLSAGDIEAGTYVYQRGQNYREGEQLFTAGERLSPKDAILLGDLGIDEVPVHAPLSVGVVATGTEIHTDRTRDLDSPMLAGLIDGWGHTTALEGTAPDEFERVRDLLAGTADEHDVVVSTGGTSVGHKDHVIRALEELGSVVFHKVRVRPGKPIALARLPNHDAIAVAIPGKPVGAHIIASLIARPLFTGVTAPYPTLEAGLTVDVGLGPEGFEYVIPVTLSDGEAAPLGHESSPLQVYRETIDPSVLSSSTRATRADGIVITTEALSRGDTVDVIPFDHLE